MPDATERFFDTYCKWFANKDKYTADIVKRLFTRHPDLCISDEKIVSFPGVNYTTCHVCGWQLNFSCECINKECKNYYVHDDESRDKEQI